MPTPTILPITTGEDDFKTTRIIGNEMFFYSDVTSDDILEFTEEFKKLENKLLKQTIDFQVSSLKSESIFAVMAEKCLLVSVP